MTDKPDAAVPAAPVERDHGPQVTFEVLGAAHEPPGREDPRRRRQNGDF